MSLRRFATLYRLRALRTASQLIRQWFPRQVQMDAPLYVHLRHQSHGQPIYSKVNVTLRAAVLAAQSPATGYYSPQLSWHKTEYCEAPRSDVIVAVAGVLAGTG